MKLLILGTFVEGALENQYARGFRNLGWDVCLYEVRKDVLEERASSIFNKVRFHVTPQWFLAEKNRNIISYVTQLKPDVVMVFKGMEIFPETLLEIKKHTKLLCNYNPDHPFLFYSRGSGNSYVLNSIKMYDIYFSYSRSICSQLEKNFNVTAKCIPFGFDETLKYSFYKRKNISDKFVFVGAWDKERENLFEQLNEFPLCVFGPTEWNRARTVGAEVYAGYSVYDQEYCDVAYSAKGMLNILRPQNIVERSHNMRTFEVPGYAGLLISNRTDEQSSFFEEDKEAIFFDGDDELKDKLSFYNSHPEVVELVKKNALNRSLLSGYSYADRAKQIANIILSYV